MEVCWFGLVGLGFWFNMFCYGFVFVVVAKQFQNRFTFFEVPKSCAEIASRQCAEIAALAPTKNDVF